MPTVRVTVELEVSAPVRDPVALAAEIVTRQGFRVVEARIVDAPEPPAPPAPQGELFG